MPQTQASVVENNFTKGLITESTGLNFPENAATDCDNVTFTLVGDVTRRLGIDYESGYTLQPLATDNRAINTYKWNNAGGDGNSQLLVTQLGGILKFFSITLATETLPISQRLIGSTVDLGVYVPPGGTFDQSKECTFADGNGYLFVFHPNCQPLYVTYTSGALIPTAIPLSIRDFTGINDNLDVSVRPNGLSNEHFYNLANQGWSSGNKWQATSVATTVAVGSSTFTVAAGLAVTLGDLVTGTSSLGTFSGTVTAYSGTNLTVNITSYTPAGGPPTGSQPWVIVPINKGLIDTWFTAEGNYPSNADVWWYFKNATDIFDPATTVGSVTLSVGRAPQGHFILDPFNQQRSIVSGIAGLTSISTLKRPAIGTWFQGRVWYSGVNDSAPASGDAPFYSWSENIYFSQINVGTSINFGNCYQTNDATAETLHDILPTDGGVIQIQGSGRIFKLFPIQNGMIVFAANGVWFITGSQGIGFAANDYTITKLSAVESIASTSFVDVLGLPYFWNEEGIYAVEPQQQGGLAVNPITVGTILTFYNSIPKESKKYARGTYHPIDYAIQWVYRSTNDGSISTNWSFDRILNYNTYNKAFFPYSVDNIESKIIGINYIQGPGGTDSPEPIIKYFTSTVDRMSVTFADEHSETYRDWDTSGFGSDYESYFITGYKLRGGAIRKFQPTYIQMYSRTNGDAFAYKIQGIWDYANSGDSGKWSTSQITTVGLTHFDVVHRRHKIRGRGYSLQFKIQSVTGMPFDLIGWAVVDTVNQGV